MTEELDQPLSHDDRVRIHALLAQQGTVDAINRAVQKIAGRQKRDIITLLNACKIAGGPDFIQAIRGAQEATTLEDVLLNLKEIASEGPPEEQSPTD
jgi:hypothetical protein